MKELLKEEQGHGRECSCLTKKTHILIRERMPAASHGNMDNYPPQIMLARSVSSMLPLSVYSL